MELLAASLYKSLPAWSCDRALSWELGFPLTAEAAADRTLGAAAPALEPAAEVEGAPPVRTLEDTAGSDKDGAAGLGLVERWGRGVAGADMIATAERSPCVLAGEKRGVGG